MTMSSGIQFFILGARGQTIKALARRFEDRVVVEYHAYGPVSRPEMKEVNEIVRGRLQSDHGWDVLGTMLLEEPHPALREQVVLGYLYGGSNN
jgi:hypothetical protein